MVHSTGNGDADSGPQSPDVPTAPGDALEAEERIKAELVAEAAKKRRTVLLLLGLIAVALGTLGWEVWHYHLSRLGPADNPSDVQIDIFEPVGSPEAKVKVVVLIEMCLESVQSLVYRVGKSYPDLVRAEFYAVHAAEAAEAYPGDRGESCAGVLVNGKDHFTITDGETTREVHFYMNPGGEYTEKDLVFIIKQEIEQAYGSIPEDFDRKVSVEYGSAIPAVGMPDAPVRVQVCLQKPSDQLIDVLSRIADAYPSQVRVEFLGSTTHGALEILGKQDGHEPRIFVNGRTAFTLGTGAARREVSFIGPPGPTYGLADLVEAIKSELLAVKSKLPPNFDEVAAVPEPGRPAGTPRATEGAR